MNILFIFLFLLFNFSKYQCETPTCKTNCTTDNDCWHEALAYRSSDLIEQLFSFSSLSIYVDTYQRNHPSEMNDSILFIDEALENHLLTELIDTNLSIDLFTETKQILIELCKNLTSVPVDGVDKLPPLICSSSTCISEAMNFMVLLIISILITSLILLICIIQSFRTHHQGNSSKKIQHSISFVNSLSTSNLIINPDANRF